MEYSTFRQCVYDEVKNSLSEDFDVSLSENIKNNSVSRWAINIKAKGKKVAPSIYLEGFYEKYNTCICDIKTIATDIVECYLEHKDDIDFDVDKFRNFSKIQKSIRCKLINREENYALLKNIPYIEFLDLVLVFYCIFNETDTYTQSCVVTNNHIALWNIKVEDLKKIALLNTRKYSCFNITAMNKIIAELFKQQLFEGELYENGEILKYINDETEENNMYVLTNKQKIFGAVAIVYDQILEDFANIINSDLYIIPSSVHEVIIIPYTKSEDISIYNQIIEEVNMNNVSKEERLSGHLYLYERGTGQVTIPTDF